MRRSRPAFPDKRRIKIQWSQDDTIELLAHLDFVIQKLRKDIGHAPKDEILRKLQPRLKKRRTTTQIDSKIKLLTGSSDPKTIEDVYRHGSSRMASLDVDLKLKVQEELKSIKSKELCIVVSTPRQLRSAPRNLDTETSRSKRESTIFGERTPTRSMRKTQRGEPQDRESKLAKKEPLSSRVRNSCKTWKQRVEYVY